jgi:hypothetical protein
MFAFLAALAVVSLLSFSFAHSSGGDTTLHASQYKLLPPITQGNLTVFPVVAVTTHDTSEFLTLDEGLRSGDVVITEAGRVAGLVRRPQVRVQSYSGAQVNQLVLVNNSKRPLLLLAGEIVTGGKQDRIIGKDRIVPVGAEPIDLNVFCVEPGRWTEQTAQFKPGSAGGAGGAFMAQPAVRANAMGAKSQQQVWDAVNENNRKTKEMMRLNAPPAVAEAVGGTTSYAQVMGNKDVQHEIDKVAAPIAQSYERVIRELRDRKAVGVVVAVGGRIIWADIFASTELLQKYWPKLARSYAAEAMLQHASKSAVEVADAEQFLAKLEGRHEVVDSEPGVYRHTEISGDGFKAFELTSLLPKTGFDLHLAKMSQ